MSKSFILLSMIFCHVIDDYFLQGILATLKQKKYWQENYPQKMYKYDYVMALLMHSFSWTFMIMLPIFFYFNFKIDVGMILIFIINFCVHTIVDNEKANEFTINLIVDQLCHLVQIVLTWIIFMFLY